MAISVTAIIAMNMPGNSQPNVKLMAYDINVEPEQDQVRQAIDASLSLTEAELRNEIARYVPRVQKTEQLAAFIHSLQLYFQKSNFSEYKTWESTWFESSTTLFVFSNLTGNEVRNALKLDASVSDLQSAYVSVVTMLPLLEEASSKVSEGLLVDVFGYQQGDLLLESWPIKE